MIDKINGEWPRLALAAGLLTLSAAAIGSDLK